MGIEGCCFSYDTRLIFEQPAVRVDDNNTCKPRRVVEVGSVRSKHGNERKNLKTKTPRGTFTNDTSKHLVLFGKTREMEGRAGGEG